MTLTLKTLLPAAFLSACLTATAAHSAAIRILPVGDSITEGYSPNPSVGTASYRRELRDLLTQDGCSFEMVGSRTTNYPNNPTVFIGNHEGYSGRTADQLRDGASDNPSINTMMQVQTPDVVLLHAGSNDMRLSNTIPGTVQEIIDIAALILNNNGNAVVFVANVIPWFNTSGNSGIKNSVDALGDQLNIAIPALGNDNIILVDVRTGFLPGYMQSDLIHPNATGEAYLASKWYDAIIAKDLCVDEKPPTTRIDQPSTAGAPLNKASFKGVANDTGSSGINRVQIAIENNAITTAGKWFNFITGTFSDISSGCGVSSPGNGCITNASLTNVSTDRANWNIDLSAGNTQGFPTLPAGDYTIYALAVDNAENDEYHGTGLAVWPVNRSFLLDPDKPLVTISNPGSSGVTLAPSPSFNGTASDTGESGIDKIQIAVKDLIANQWIDLSTGELSDSIQHTNATLSNTSVTSTDWQLDTSLPKGSYKLFVRAWDKAGNRNSYVARSFSVVPPDGENPTTAITNPITNNAILSPAPTLTGTAADTGGSGFDYVRVAIKNTTTNTWLNFDSGNFVSGFKHTKAMLTDTTTTNTNWQIATNLGAGNYQIFALAFDNAGNRDANAVRSFKVALPDNEAPGTTITNPAENNETLASSPTLTGTATDSGGSGFDYVRVAIKNTVTGQWLNFGNGGFSNSFKHTKAALSNTTTSSTNWQITTTLSAGNYQLFALTFDNAGNRASNVVRKFKVGTPDAFAPTTTITNPTVNDETLASSPTLTGTAADSGGSGFDYVRVAIKNTTTGQWLNFANGSFSNGFKHTKATLSNTTTSNTNWQVATSLAAGNYQLLALAFDNAGNRATNAVRKFKVGTPDAFAPTTAITNPAINNEILPPSPTLTGTAADSGGSGFDYVRVAIKNTTTGQWLNFANGSFSPGFKHTKATLSNTTTSNTNWRITTTLGAGNYQLFALAFDNAGNRESNVVRKFTIGSL